MKKKINLFLVSFFTFLSLSSQNITGNQFIEDLDFLTSEMRKIVPDFQVHVNQDDFKLKINQLKEKANALTNSQVVLGFQELLCMMNDEGIKINPFQDLIDSSILPIKTYWFQDGIYVCDAAENYRDIIGEKLLSINGTNIETLFQQMIPVLPGDNKYSKRYSFLLYAQIPAWLEFAGLNNGENYVVLKVASGKEYKVSFEPVEDYIKLNRQLPNYQNFMFNNTKHPDKNYWMEYLKEKKILFIQFLQIRNDKSEVSFKKFIKKINSNLNNLDVEKIVIDTRYGGGGNGFKLKPLTDLFKKNKEVNKKGKLFVLTSRRTGGTLLELTSLLELNTKAIIIGEPTGEGPNTVGDTKSIELPNSGIKVSLTKKFWPTSWSFDTRKALMPDISVDFLFNYYKQKKDPWLDEVFRYTKTTKQMPLEDDIKKSIIGTYKVQGRKVTIKEIEDRVFISMQRKMKDFFEFEAELFYKEEGLLSTSIKDVFLSYKKDQKGDVNPITLNWKGTKVNFKK